MGDFASAVVGASAVLVVGYVSNILKEDYVRLLDGRALASALAGELTGHRSGLTRVEKNLAGLIQAKQMGHDFPLRVFATPTSPVFESSVGKLGLLGSPLAGDVAFLYEHIRAFRINYAMLTEQVGQMSAEEQLTRLELLKELVVDSQPLADRTIAGLNAHASQRFLPWLADRLGISQFAGARGDQSATAPPAINPTQGDDPSGSAR
ncbi:hypothetical protein WL21_09905 [Burkholderia ubonensis]|uniref:hypothetical protein n=1 Tax=Burkholderia ubonensis TaxID=101571 RepID=UPI00075CDBFE|nr:hypothetical protein [Burkholderia ubonensis]KVO83337.1 hypothetical protein WJ81_23125 [Burkholderia ubonensis]KVZ58984.1 hypothetical protein WL20_20525 [Burkholderia ubonensis]KVZ70612.1 hypothetical protein WL21_09905 [Burkholderia ubonensis]